jgi:CRISPR/Cas system CSM-associated protein Csm4 (group 5 of RAMP superfamily)
MGTPKGNDQKKILFNLQDGTKIIGEANDVLYPKLPKTQRVIGEANDVLHPKLPKTQRVQEKALQQLIAQKTEIKVAVNNVEDLFPL